MLASESLRPVAEEAQNKLEKAQGHIGNLIKVKIAYVTEKNIKIIRDY